MSKEKKSIITVKTLFWYYSKTFFRNQEIFMFRS